MNNKIALVPTNRWPIASLIAGVGFSVAACWIVAHFNQVQREEAVTAAAEMAADGVVSRIELYQYGLRGARGAIQTMASSQAITREGFDLYSKTRNVDEEFPGARGFGFIRRVPLQDEAEFLTQAQVDGWPEFAIRQIAPHQSERYIIQYINPVERNLAAIGLDIASEANRRQAALSSMRSGEVRLTGPITLVQATGKPQQSFLILMPIFRSGSPPDTPEAREAQTLGWSYPPLSA
ncbi:CHASE domain-containing protein [Halomonas colorata]|uniref:CHASE domain-containing protein n=1 Tax=Halomonas colorata TaxID=2742615 RepID=UPI001868F9CB|nr:CHASE domain-containing protein [Halomonas colorata]